MSDMPSSDISLTLLPSCNEIWNVSACMVITLDFVPSIFRVSGGKMALTELPFGIGSLGREIPGSGIGIDANDCSVPQP